MHAILLLHRALRIRTSVLEGCRFHNRWSWRSLIPSFCVPSLPAVSVRSASFASEFRELSYSLMRFRHSLPPIEAAFSHPPPFAFQFLSSRDNTSSTRATQTASLHTLSFAHMISMGAVITLHGLAGLQTAGYLEIALRAAKDMAKLLSALDNVNASILHSSVGVSIPNIDRCVQEADCSPIYPLNRSLSQWRSVFFWKTCLLDGKMILRSGPE